MKSKGSRTLLTENPLQTELRRMRRLRELGSDDALCCLCGENDPATLTRCRKTIMEKHHVSGQSNDPDMLVVVCLNCHRKATEKQRKFGVELCHGERNVLEKLLNVLKSLASFFQLLADSLLLWAQRLAEVISRLDANYPDWRKKTAKG
jgi:hypothetical protein